MNRIAGFEYLDHVSDVRLRAWGPSLEETFAEASLGMWAVIADPGDVPALLRWTVSASGSDLHELLVNLLNEQILRFDSDGLVAGGVESVVVAGLGDTAFAAKGDISPFGKDAPAAPENAFTVSAVLAGCRSSELAKPVMRCIKAATFQDLLVSATLVEVTLDV